MTNYFPPNETACRCGCGKQPTPKLLAKINQIREDYGSPLYCSSGARCDEYTAKLRAQGTPAALHSKHIEGLAADLVPTKETIAHFHAWTLSRLGEFDIWIEDQTHTPTWQHIQIAPYASWKPGLRRAFIP